VVVSLVAIPDQVLGPDSRDKVAHVVAYLVVMAWFVQIWSAQRVILAYAGFLVVLGIVLELLQGMGGQRTADSLDALANAGGVFLGWLTSWTPVSGLLGRFEERLGSSR
jgi:membrane associated rhomboid family serine protease